MKKTLNAIYAFKFLDDFILIYPLYVVMFTDAGMQPWQVAALLMAWSATSFILEIPSGAWADKYNRKNLILLGQLIRAAGYLCWLFFPSFLGFLVGFVLWGIKGALTSGTFQAFLYDELKHHGRQGEFTKILGRTQTLSLVAILLASLLASPAILLGYPFVLVLSSLAVLLSGLMIWRCPSNAPQMMNQEVTYFSVLKKGVHMAFRDKTIWQLLVFMALFVALCGGLDEFWPIFASESGLPDYGLGIYCALMSGAEALGSFGAYRWENKGYAHFYGLTILNGLLLCLAAWLFNVLGLILLVLFSFLFSLLHVLLEGKLHHTIASDARATIASVSGFLIELVVMIAFFGFGVVAQIMSYQKAFLIFGFIIASTGLIYLIPFIRQKSPDKAGQKRTAR